MTEPLEPLVITKNIIRLSALTGFTTAALFIIFAGIILQKIPTMLHIGIGMITCTICSIFNVKIHEDASHDNDAGAFRGFSSLWSSAIGGVFLGIFFAIERHTNISNVFISAIILCLSTAFTSLGFMFFMGFLLVIPVLLLEGIFKIFRIEKKQLFDENRILLLTTIYCSVAIMAQFYYFL